MYSPISVPGEECIMVAVGNHRQMVNAAGEGDCCVCDRLLSKIWLEFAKSGIPYRYVSGVRPSGLGL